MAGAMRDFQYAYAIGNKRQRGLAPLLPFAKRDKRGNGIVTPGEGGVEMFEGKTNEAMHVLDSRLCGKAWHLFVSAIQKFGYTLL
jgi:hypothetical protein